MSLYMIEWTSLDTKVTTSAFASGVMDCIKTMCGAEDAPKMKVVSSVHVVGEPKGYLLVDADAADIQQLIVALPPQTVQTEIYSVIDDAAAKNALAHRHSEYKLK